MLDFILSLLAMVLIFVICSLVLVKLYRHGVKVWMVHTAIALCVFFYIVFRPFELTETSLTIFLTFVFASIFVTEKPVTKRERSSSGRSKETSNSSSSFSESLLSIVLLYGIFDFFDDSDDW